MNKAAGFNRLGRKSSHRKALHRNLVTSLFKYERVQTTLAKAKEVRRTAEKLITRAKVDSVQNRRLVATKIQQKNILHKLFVEISPRFRGRSGGYTRIYKLGYRQNDAAEMALLELVGSGLDDLREREELQQQAKPRDQVSSPTEAEVSASPAAAN